MDYLSEHSCHCSIDDRRPFSDELTLQFPCPTCSATLSLPDDATGRQAQCPGCQSIFQVPANVANTVQADQLAAVLGRASTDSIGCPGCHKLLAFNAATAGQVVICPACQRRLRMPTAAAFYAGTAMADDTAASWSATPRRVGSRPDDRSPVREPLNPYSSSTSELTRPASAAQQMVARDYRYAIPAWLLLGSSALAIAYDLLWSSMVVGINPGQLKAAARFEMAVILAWAIISFLTHSLMLLGAVRMMQQRSLGIARLGALLGLLPCGGCWILQLPFAIWAIVVLHNSQAAQDFTD